METVFVLLGFTAIAVYEIPEIVRERQYRELWAVVALLLLGLGLVLPQVFHVPFPHWSDAAGHVADKIIKLLHIPFWG
ncbi:MAG: hypothetical protein ACM3QZ_10155 [Solirubrobacterales bacterium]